MVNHQLRPKATVKYILGIIVGSVTTVVVLYILGIFDIIPVTKEIIAKQDLLTYISLSIPTISFLLATYLGLLAIDHIQITDNLIKKAESASIQLDNIEDSMSNTFSSALERINVVTAFKMHGIDYLNEQNFSQNDKEKVIALTKILDLYSIPSSLDSNGRNSRISIYNSIIAELKDHRDISLRPEDINLIKKHRANYLNEDNLQIAIHEVLRLNSHKLNNFN